MTVTRKMGWALTCPHGVMIGGATDRLGIVQAVEALEPEPGDKIQRVPADEIRVALKPCSHCMLANMRVRGRHLRRPVEHDAYCRCDLCVTEFGTEALP